VIPLFVANTAFGGTFTSILTSEIRIKRGWSYGVGSVFDLYRERGSVGIGMFPKVQDTVPAIELTLKLLHEYLKQGLPADRIASAKEYMINRFPFELETAFKRASMEAGIFLRGKPKDLIQTYTQRVKKVTPKDADKAFAEFLDPDNMVIVVVGPAKDLEKPLRAIKGVKEFVKLPYDSDLDD
jgi:zinc protease